MHDGVVAYDHPQDVGVNLFKAVVTGTVAELFDTRLASFPKGNRR